MSLQQQFRGTGIAIVTPFNSDRSIDWHSFGQLVEFWINGKIDYLVVLGTTGESATIHGEEKQQVFSFVQKAVNGRVPLVAGIGGNDTRRVISEFGGYDLTGYSAILSVAPYYNKPNQEGLFRHYQAVAAAAPLPVMIYNVPGRTGQNLTAATQLRIARECPNVFATKEASGNLDQISQVLANRPDGFLVISGDDALTVPMLALGADGVTSVIANAYPRGFSDMVRAGLAGDFQTARTFHHRYSEVIRTLFAEGSPSGVKAYLSRMNLCQHTFREPVCQVSPELFAEIGELMKTVE